MGQGSIGAPSVVVGALEPVSDTYLRFLEEYAEHEGGWAPRVLLTVFLRDRPGILLAVLETLDRGVSIGQIDGPVSFSVTGSLSASLVGVGAIAVVAKPMRGHEPVEDQALIAEATTVLREAVRLNLIRNDIIQEGDNVGDVLNVERLQAGGDRALFVKSELREVRFGFPQEAGCAPSAEVLAEFSRELARLAIPIAYFHFPHTWDPPSDESRCDPMTWMRVGFAAPSHSGGQLEAEFSAYNVAEKFDCELFLSNANSPESQYSRRFERFRESTLSSPLAAPPTSRPTSSPLSCLFVRGVARPGFVSEVVADCLNAAPLAARGETPVPFIAGGTMSVLHGHSMLTLAVPTEAAEAIIRELERPVDGIDLTDAARPLSVRVSTSPVGATTLHSSDASAFTFWIGWRCAESIGVVRRLLTSTGDFFPRGQGAAPSVVYAVSRVLEDGFSCAGKLKLEVGVTAATEAGLVSQEQGFQYDGALALCETLRATISNEIAAWNPSEQSWKEQPVVVTPHEPDEEPWATLSVARLS